MLSASENNGGTPEDEAHLLVPWYVTRQLEDADARTLEDLASKDPEMARAIAEAAREAEATVFLYDSIEGPSPEIWARLDRSVEAQRRGSFFASPRTIFASVATSLQDVLHRLTAADWKLAATAVLTVCFLQTAMIAYLLQGPGSRSPEASNKFTAASGPKTVKTTTQPSCIVEFKATAAIADISALLDEAGVTIIEGPLPENTYLVAPKGGGVENKQTALRMLKASPLVVRAL